MQGSIFDEVAWLEPCPRSTKSGHVLWPTSTLDHPGRRKASTESGAQFNNGFQQTLT
ncbi:hypothetical protein [Alkalibacillus flavidus]|uniref:hypothetical protein n=1 Tax=Alkalibacillus flavidus TaxID=546021 RepID=UPI003670F861